MISADPRTISSRVAWVMVVALLAAALAGAITAAVHYRGEVAALRRELRSVPASQILRPGRTLVSCGPGAAADSPTREFGQQLLTLTGA